VVFPPPTSFTDQLTSWFELPPTVAVNCCVWLTRTVGLDGLTVTAMSTVRSTAFEVPPPGLGVTTLTGNVPAVVSCAAGMTAVNCVELPTVVVTAVPLNWTVDCWANPVPVTVSVVSPLPASMVVGEIEVMDGDGLLIVAEAEPLWLVSTAAVAVTVTAFGVGGTGGAVYKPEVPSMLPHAAPPAVQVTDQVTP